MMKLGVRWRKREDGTTAIEFSLLLIPYMMLALGIIELSIMYTAANLLEGATGTAARMVRTGELQQSGSTDPEADFRQAMCQFATRIVNCEEVVLESVVLESYDDYAGPVFDENGNMVSQGFNTGGSNTRVLIRAAYRHNMMTPLIGPLLSAGTGSRIFISTVVLQTEPYDPEA